MEMKKHNEILPHDHDGGYYIYKKKKDEITGIERMWREENPVNC